MFKQLILAIVIFVFSVSIAVAGCIIPQGTDVMMFTRGGMSPTIAPIDRPVVESKEQASAELLKEFSAGAGEDWTDGIIVFDKDYVIYLLIHKKDLVGECEVEETK